MLVVSGIAVPVACFYGNEVLVAGRVFMPFWGKVESKAPDGSSVTSYEGAAYMLLETIATKLNFTIRESPSVSYADAAKQVQERKVFININYHILMTVRAERFDYSFIYEYSYFGFAMAMPEQKPQWQGLYYPLALEVWLAVVVALILVPLAYGAVTHIQLKEIEHRIGLGVVFQHMTGILLGQNLPDRLSSTSSNQVLVAAWLVFGLILGHSYRGNLTASLTLPKYPPRPETIPELVESVDRITVLGYGSVHKQYYSESTSPLFNALARLMDVGPSVREGLNGALKYKRAHLAGQRFLQYQIAKEFTAADGSSRLYVGREALFPGPSGWPVPHDAPFTAQLNWCIMAAVESGVYTKWVTDLLTDARLDSQRRERLRQAELVKKGEEVEVREVSRSLTITHTQGAFMLLPLGTCLAFIAILAELLVFWFYVSEFKIGSRP